MRHGGAILFDVRRGELKKTLLMAATILLIVASYMMVKSARSAIFLSRFGTDTLALLYIVLAATAGTFSAISNRLGHGVSRNRLILLAHLIFAASLIVIWGALHEESRLTSWVLWIWSSFFGRS